MTVGAVVPAAGRGERLGPGGPKALRRVGGEPLLVHAVRALRASSVGPLVVVAPPDDTAGTAALLPPDVVVVPGGATRQESVALGLAALPREVDVVLVHDAARCLVPPALVDAVARAVLDGADAVVPVLPVADTVKRVGRDGTVLETPPRGDLRAVQTPQGFRRGVLEHAHRAAAGLPAEAATDDAGLVEALGVAVRTVPGHEEAFKVTRPLDLLLAEAVLAGRPADAPGRRPAAPATDAGGQP